MDHDEIQIQTKSKGQGKGKGLVKRYYDKKAKGALEGIGKPCIRRMARRGGVKRISGAIYGEARGVMREYMAGVIGEAIIYMEHAKRRTVTAMDVVNALKRRGNVLYGYGG